MLSRKTVWLGTGAAISVAVLVAVVTGQTRPPENAAEDTGLDDLPDAVSNPAALEDELDATVDPTALGRPSLNAPMDAPIPSLEDELPATSAPQASAGFSSNAPVDASMPIPNSDMSAPMGFRSTGDALGVARSISQIAVPGRELTRMVNQQSGAWPAQMRDPEMLKLVEADRKMEQEVRNLAGQIRKSADSEQRAELRKGLEELTAKHFDLRQQQRQLQIDRMAAELEKIRQAVQKRTDTKKLIVQRRVSQLLGEQDELAFPPPPRFQRQTSWGRQGLQPRDARSEYAPRNENRFQNAESRQFGDSFSTGR